MNQKFGRFKAMMALISAALAGGMSHYEAFQSVGTYKSRGKGRGTPSRVFGRSNSKYSPHIGAKEQAKHAKRMAASAEPLRQAA